VTNYGVVLLYTQELEEKDIEIEFYKEQERLHHEEIMAYKRVEVSRCDNVHTLAKRSKVTVITRPNNGHSQFYGPFLSPQNTKLNNTTRECD